MIAQTLPAVNSYAAHNYGDVKHKHKIMREATKDKCYDPTTKLLISELVNNSNFEGVTRISQGTLAILLGCSIDTIRRRLILLEKDGLIPNPKKNGWGKTNTVTLLPIKNELNHKDRNLRCNLNPTNLKHNNINTYKENVDVSLIYEYEKEMDKAKKPEARQKGGFKIDNEKLCSSLPIAKQEIERACTAHGLNEDLHGYVLQAMTKRCGVSNPGGFLLGIIKNVKSNPPLIAKSPRIETPEERYTREKESLPTYSSGSMPSHVQEFLESFKRQKIH